MQNSPGKNFSQPLASLLDVVKDSEYVEAHIFPCMLKPPKSLNLCLLSIFPEFFNVFSAPFKLGNSIQYELKSTGYSHEVNQTQHAHPSEIGLRVITLKTNVPPLFGDSGLKLDRGHQQWPQLGKEKRRGLFIFTRASDKKQTKLSFGELTFESMASWSWSSELKVFFLKSSTVAHRLLYPVIRSRQTYRLPLNLEM